MNSIATKYADLIMQDTSSKTANAPTMYARVLAAITEATENQNATIAACKAAGFIDAEGRVRKVAHNASLPITADGYIAVYGETYLYWDTVNSYHDPIKYGWTERELESCPPHDAEYSWTTNPALCFCDRAAAEASKQKGKP